MTHYSTIFYKSSSNIVPCLLGDCLAVFISFMLMLLVTESLYRHFIVSLLRKLWSVSYLEEFSRCTWRLLHVAAPAGPPGHQRKTAHMKQGHHSAFNAFPVIMVWSRRYTSLIRYKGCLLPHYKTLRDKIPRLYLYTAFRETGFHRVFNTSS